MSQRWPGSLINKTAPTPSGGGAGDSAPGVWTLDQANPYIANGTWPGTGTPDPQFQYVTALLHGDGTNGGQNNTFLDSSTNNFTITRNGNTTQGSFSPYGNLWSNYFNGTSYLTSSANTAFEMGSGDFTLESWIFVTSNPTNNSWCIFSKGIGGAVGTEVYSFQINQNTGYLYFYSGNYTGTVSPVVVSPSAIPFNTWTHVAVTRSGSTTTLWVNGTSVNTNTGWTTQPTGGNVYVGAQWYDPTASGRTAFGYISNLRFIKGTAVYTSNFTPSTTPLTAISGTSLLTCQSNRFIDNSSNAFAITVNGTPSVQRFSPFQNLATYQTAKIGGSAYFDGSGDSISATNAVFNPSGQDLTVSFWMYVVSYPATFNMVFEVGTGTSNNVQCPVLNTGELRFQVGGVLGSQISGVKLNNWHFVTCVKSGTNFTVYLDNVAGNTVSLTASSDTQLRIGSDGAGGTNFNGYIANFRYIAGSAIAPTSIPTAPLTPITNTQFLANFTNGSIYDNASMNDLETVGNAQISTSVKKYGTGSLAFDGTGDYLVSQINPTVNLGSGNFTVEGWFYFNAVGTNNYEMISKETLNAANNGFRVVLNSSQKVVVNMSSNGTSYSLTITGSTTIAANTWYHVAISKVGTTVTSYINGNQDGSGTFSGSLYETNTFWALATRGGYGTTMNGYIDDFRVTAGYARYWFNFQPPSAPYPNYGGTLQLTYDPYFENTTLLLNGEGTNGAQNNTFLDSSTNNFTITRNGNTTQGSFSPYGSNWSNYFDGSGDYLSTPNSANLVLNASDFTVECWVNVSTLAALQRLMVWSNGTGSDVNYSWTMDIQTSGIPRCYIGSFGGINAPGAVNIGSWNHIAIVRSGSAITVYLNGTGGVASSPSVQAVSDGTLTIGADRSGGSPTTGYISNIRILKGTALYTANFTPPTAPLTAITNTQLLTCQSNRFVDNSANNFTLTVSGNTAVQRFSPFNPTSTYSTSVIGGSGYFYGSGGNTDYLSIGTTSALNFGTGNFTIEFWVYPVTNSNSFSSGAIIASGNSAWGAGAVVIAGASTGYGTPFNSYDFNSGGTPIVTTGANGTPLNAWTHIAVTRSGNTFTMYKNGVSVSTGTFSGNINFNTNNATKIGGGSWDNQSFPGYMVGLRATNSVVYTGTFTPPTAPVTAITNTQLLTNFTNAGIPDLAMQNDLQTVGNAQVSTAQYKYGTSSLYFDGTGDYLTAVNPNNFNFGTGDFTIEAWVYGSIPGSGYFDICGNAFSNTGVVYEFASYNGKLRFTTWFAVVVDGSTTIPSNQWNHVAVTRASGVTRLFLNGALNGSASDTNNYSTTNTFGVGYAGGVAWNGYIDDLRITKGLARYVQNFTPPTAALPTY